MFMEIIKILQTKQSRNGNAYLRVEFLDEAGKFWKTDLCPDYRNWRQWKNLLKVGNHLGNLRKKDENTIDADSMPILISGKKTTERTIEEYAKLGVFG